jgi:DNA-directed RNA polymerase specialized sigma24 family protein
VVALLRGRGVDSATADDISQEVALRAVSSGVRYSSADDLMRWAATVAIRLSVDDWRRKRRMVLTDEALGRVVADVDRQAVHRAQLHEVADCIARLTPNQRAALVSGMRGEEGSNRAEAGRMAVARHRARARLREWTDGIAGGMVAIRLRLRQRFGDSQPALAGLATYVAAVGVMFPVSSSPPHEPVREPAAVVSGLAPAGGAGDERLAAIRAAVPGRFVVDAPRAPMAKSPWDGAHALASVPIPDGGPPLLVATRENRPDDSLVCVGNLMVVPDTCAGKPILPRR